MPPPSFPGGEAPRKNSTVTARNHVVEEVTRLGGSSSPYDALVLRSEMPEGHYNHWRNNWMASTLKTLGFGRNRRLCWKVRDDMKLIAGEEGPSYPTQHAKMNDQRTVV